MRTARDQILLEATETVLIAIRRLTWDSMADRSGSIRERIMPESVQASIVRLAWDALRGRSRTIPETRPDHTKAIEILSDLAHNWPGLVDRTGTDYAWIVRDMRRAADELSKMSVNVAPELRSQADRLEAEIATAETVEA